MLISLSHFVSPGSFAMDGRRCFKFRKSSGWITEINSSLKTLLLPWSKWSCARSLGADCFSHLVLKRRVCAGGRVTQKKTNPKASQMRDVYQRVVTSRLLVSKGVQGSLVHVLDRGQNGNPAVSSNNPLITDGQIRHTRGFPHFLPETQSADRTNQWS